MENLEALNRKFFLAINADQATSLMGLAKFLAKDTLYLLPLLLIALWIWGGGARRQLVIKALATTIVSLGLGVIAGLIYVHQRPFVMGLGHTYIQHKPNASFPSHHATIFAAIAFTLLAATGTRLLGLIVLVFGVLAGWARIYTGLHFPFDIIGGFIMAAVGYAIVAAFWNKYWKDIHDKICRR